jgi:hypothetical protein
MTFYSTFDIRNATRCFPLSFLNTPATGVVVGWLPNLFTVFYITILVRGMENLKVVINSSSQPNINAGREDHRIKRYPLQCF